MNKKTIAIAVLGAIIIFSSSCLSPAKLPVHTDTVATDHTANTPTCLYPLIGKAVEYRSTYNEWPGQDSISSLFKSIQATCDTQIDSVATVIYSADSADYHLWVAPSPGIPIQSCPLRYRLAITRHNTMDMRALPTDTVCAPVLGKARKHDRAHKGE